MALPLGERARRALEGAKKFPEGRWFLLELESEQDAWDVEQLVLTKSRPPRRKAPEAAGLLAIPIGACPAAIGIGRSCAMEVHRDVAGRAVQDLRRGWISSSAGGSPGLPPPPEQMPPGSPEFRSADPGQVAAGSLPPTGNDRPARHLPASTAMPELRRVPPAIVAQRSRSACWAGRCSEPGCGCCGAPTLTWGENWSPDPGRSGSSTPWLTEGVYRHIRHPMYAAHWLWGLGQALLLQNWIARSLHPGGPAADATWCGSPRRSR